jgi:hypothetical protein
MCQSGLLNYERSRTTDLTLRIQEKADSQRAMQGIHNELVVVIHTGGAYSLFAPMANVRSRRGLSQDGDGGITNCPGHQYPICTTCG